MNNAACKEKLEDQEPRALPDPGDKCGRWRKGLLRAVCRLGTTEFCQNECPHRRRKGSE